MPSGSSEALVAASGNNAHVWQPFSKDPDLHHFSVAAEGRIYSVQWNQNNKVIVSGGHSGVVSLHYNRDQSLMGTLPKDAPTEEDRLAPISSLSFSRGSRLLAAGCMDSTVRVWDLKQQTCKYSLEGHKAAVTYVAFSSDDQYLASACLTGEIHLHTVRHATQAAVLRTPGNRAKRSLHFTPLEPLLASGAEDGSLYVWDTSTYTLLDSYIQTHEGTVSRVCFSPGSPNILISAALDKAIVLTDRRLDAAIASVQCGVPLSALDCKDDGNCITVGTTSGTVLLYDPRKLQLLLAKLTCSGGDPVSCLHWQQSVASKPAARRSSTSPTAATPAAPHPVTSAEPPRSLARGQDLLSIASPATPLHANANQAEGIEAGERAGRSPIKTASAKSGQSPSVSEASFISAAQHADGQGGHTDNNDLFAPLSSQRPDSRTPALPPTHNNGARTSGQADLRNPLFPSLKPEGASQRGRGGQARETEIQPLPGDSAAASIVSLRGDSAAEVGSPEPRAGRSAKPADDFGRINEGTSNAVPSDRGAANGAPSNSNPGLDPDTGPPPPLSVDPEAPLQTEGPAALFGVRLKRLKGGLPETSGAANPTATGNGPGGGALEAQHHSLAITTTGPSPEATGEWDHIADDIKRSFSSDIKTLHFEMIRQFHIQQVEMKEVMDAMISRQDMLVKEVTQLRSQVQKLMLRQASENYLQ